MSTVWKNQDSGVEWGKGVTVIATRGTVWGPGDTASGPIPPDITQNIDPNTLPDGLEGAEGQPEAPEAVVEGFPCRHPGCAKVAKSAAGLAAHARKAH